MTNSKGSDRSGWKAHRLEQHLAFKALSFDEKLKHLENLADFAREVLEGRKRKGLPYIDPVSGKRVSSVAEDPEPYGDR